MPPGSQTPSHGDPPEDNPPPSSRTRLGAIRLKRVMRPRSKAGEPSSIVEAVEETDAPPSGLRGATLTMDLDDDDDDVGATESFTPIPIDPGHVARISAAMAAATSGGTGGIAAIAAHELARATSARQVLVHLHEPRNEVLCTIGAAGAEAKAQLGVEIDVASDFLADALWREGRTVTICFETGVLPGFAPRRFAEMDAKRSVVAVPARHDGRIIGMIELVDADAHLGSAAETVEHVAAELATLITRGH